jgi:plastocyanin
MLNMEFSPATVEISKGETIKWKNTDIVPHTATSAEFGDSGVITSGGAWRHKFKEAGEFPYECTLHPMMKGTVIVK